MAQLTFILLSALVASFHSQFANASPLMVKGEWAPRLSIWNDSPLVATAPDSAMISEVVEFAPELSAAAASNSGTDPTMTQWETTTLTVQSTVTAAPFNAGSQSQTWVLPEVFTDLSPFRIDRIAYGSSNIAVVTGIPAKASATQAFPTPVITPSIFTKSVLTSPELPRRWTNNSCAYRLFFPSGSINPGNKPQGGSDFYATPLPVHSATNVTLQYSVFFPADFEWVHGGKLPGLYGGHEGCSGGNGAKSCFSTRMMWRQGGAGELYLVRIPHYSLRYESRCRIWSSMPQRTNRLLNSVKCHRNPSVM
jgi:Polysaccharide lyase 14